MTIRHTYTERVESLSAAGTLRDAARQMRDSGVGMLVVRDGDRCVGIVTDRNLVTRALADGLDPDRSVSVAMTTPPQTIGLDARLEEAVVAMRDGGHRRLLVVDDTGAPVGVVSIDDVLQRLGFLAHGTGEMVHAGSSGHPVTYVS